MTTIDSPTRRVPRGLSIAELDAVVDAHLQAELREDLPAVLSTLSTDVRHDVIGAPEPAIGHEQVAGFYTSLWNDLAVEEMVPVRRLHGPDFVVDEVLVTAKAVGNPFGMAGNGRTVRFRLVHVFEVDGDRIVRETAALDMPAIQRQLS